MSRLGAGIYALLAVALFGAFGYLAHQQPYFPGDVSVSLWLQGIASLKPVMLLVSYVTSPLPAAAAVILLAGGLWLWGKRSEAIAVASASFSAALISFLVKLPIDRPRPGGEMLLVLEQTSGTSFPSLHTACALVFGGLIFYLAPRLVRRPVFTWVIRSVAVIAVILVAVSRIYLGVHWLSDVLGGLLLGGLLLYPAIVLYHKYASRQEAGDRDAGAA